jgi:hypothetical protein
MAAGTQHERLLALLEAVCEERASAEDFAEIERLVLASPDARWVYLTYLDLHGTLLWDAAGGLGVSVPTVAGRARERPRNSRGKAGWLVAAAALLLAAVGFFAGSRDRPQLVTVAPQPSNSVSSDVSRDGGPAERGPVRLEGQPEPPRNVVQLPPGEPAEATAALAEAARPAEPAATSVPQGSVQRVVSRIDELLEADWRRLEVTPAPRADDAEWVRRVYLQLAGRIPTVVEVERFLDDARSDKRARLVDALLDDVEFARNFATIWTQLLVGRSPNPRVDREALQKYLRMSFAANRPWHEMVADLLAAEGRTDQNGAANFLVAHLNNQAVPATAITSRLFLGVQLHCAQCHNHPFNDVKQTTFWEFNSLFQQADVVVHRAASMPSGAAVAELVNHAEGGPIYYETVNGLMKVAYPKFNGTEIDPSPQVNRRKELARLMASGERPQLAVAFVNRLWAHFLGAGFTRPLDDMGPHNPPSHPELLDFLSEEFVRSGYDVRQLIRWICRSTAYQLSSRHPAGDDEIAAGVPATFKQVYVRPMSAEQLYDSLVTATQAHRAGAVNWEAAEAKRRAWLQQFVVSLENDENDETETLSGTYAQALMLMNGELMEESLSLAPGTFLGDLVRDRSPDSEKIRRLCLAALSRPPTAKELPAMQKLIHASAANKSRTNGRAVPAAAGYQDLFWALLNSNEFALVH